MDRQTDRQTDRQIDLNFTNLFYIKNLIINPMCLYKDAWDFFSL